jgi:hypothetical protein
MLTGKIHSTLALQAALPCATLPYTNHPFHLLIPTTLSISESPHLIYSSVTSRYRLTNIDLLLHVEMVDFANGHDLFLLAMMSLQNSGEKKEGSRGFSFGGGESI